MEKSSGVPTKLIGYVARTGETVILNAKQRNSQFNNDEYLANHQPKSLLCLPVAAKGRNIGVFYLENNLVEGLFKKNSLDLLQLLSSQIAISLDNANLYKNLENIIEAHTIELKEKNNELQKANKLLAAADEAKTRFVANVSHEIRTPLQGIIGMIYLLSKTREYNDIYISMIQSSADMLARIIDDILDIAKIESNRLDLEEKTFDLQLLLQHVVHDFKELAYKKNINFVFTVDPDLPGFLLADAYRIRQILNNLLTNAIKFTEKGTVELSVLVAERREGIIIVQFMVRDTGIGIPADKLDTIFENFAQLQTIKFRNLGGVGLGLAIVKKLVELMNGKLSVKSSEGKGSVFTCLLPMKTVPQTEADTLPPGDQFVRHEKEDLQGIKIIAAEDNEINRMYIQKLLQYYNFDVIVVENSAQLLQQLEISDYDCALLDKNMPGTDGIETARTIR